MKHTSDDLDLLFNENESPCEECEALPGQDHKPWCLVGQELAEGADDEEWPPRPLV